MSTWVCTMDPDLISSIFHSCVSRGVRAQLGEGVVNVDMCMFMVYVFWISVSLKYVCLSWSGGGLEVKV